MQLKGKTALVAGAGRNNGKAIAVAFAREGADLVLVAKTRGEALGEVVQECERLGANVVSLLADLTREEEVERVVKIGLDRFGKIDVLVSVVGIRPHKAIWEQDSAEWLRVFDVNLHATFYLAKAVAPSMMRQKSGSIIALGGLASVTVRPNAGAVVASKHGLYGLIKSLAFDLGPYGIRANLINPNMIDNVRENPEWYPHREGGQFTKAEIASNPLGRIGKPEEVANVAVFLASDASSFVTGDRINCVGGKYM